MKVRVKTLKRMIVEGAMHEALGSTTFDFEVYGPNDETYTVTATYNEQTPYDIEIWKAVGPDGNEIDVEELEAQGHDLQAKAFDELPNKVNDMDPPGTGFDDPY